MFLKDIFLCAILHKLSQKAYLIFLSGKCSVQASKFTKWRTQSFLALPAGPSLCSPSSAKLPCHQKALQSVIKTSPTLVTAGCKKGTPTATLSLTPAMPKRCWLSLSQDNPSTGLSDGQGLIFKTQPETGKNMWEPYFLSTCLL